MPEQLGDVEEVSCAAAKIEDALPARQIELDVTNSANVDCDPTVEIEIFRPVCAGIGYRVTLANLRETDRIDRFNDALFFERKPPVRRKDLSVCFLALTSLRPSTSFRILCRNRT